MTADLQDLRRASAPRLDGATRVFVIIGDPIAQAKSPELLTVALAGRGANAVVVPGHVGAEGVDAFMAGMTCMRNVDAIIATVPHKQAMMAHCASVTDRARCAGAANVLWRTAEGWSGDNTDGMGHVAGIVAKGRAIEGARVLLVGAGGAGCAMAFEFLDRGAAHLAIHDIDAARRDAVTERLNARFPDRLSVGSDDPRGFDIVANATPLGMREGDPLPIMTGDLEPGQFVSDVVTAPEVPPLIAAARAAGCGTMTGTEMFQAQKEMLADILLTRPVPI